MKNALVIKAAVLISALVLTFVVGQRFSARERDRAPSQTEGFSTVAPAPIQAARKPTISSLKTSVSPMSDPATCLATLASLTFTNDAIRISNLRRVIQQLENLADSGPPAVPLIHEFLASQKDVYLPGRGEGLIPASLRTGLYDVLRRIGGAEAESVLVSMLGRTESGYELRHLSRVIEDMAPGRYRDRIIQSGLDLATRATPGTGDAARRDREMAYEILGRAGDHSLIAKAQGELITSSGRLDDTALRYLTRTMGDASIPLIQQALADPRLTHGDGRENLVEALRDRMEQSPEAVRALQQIAADTSLGRRERDEAFDALARINDTTLVETAKNSLVTAEGRINESALRYLERAVGDAVLADVAQVWGDPRVMDQSEREELVQTIVTRVGRSEDATRMWQEIAANAQMPANLREEAIGELDDRGLNRRRPTEADKQIALARMRLLEQLAPSLQDARLAERANRVYRELNSIVVRP